jgi:hypothetical protein
MKTTMNSETDMSPSPHPANGELAAYLDRTLADDDRRRIEAHLADCDYCCEQISVATRSLSGLRKRHWPRLAMPGLAVAAALAAFLIVGPQLGEQGSSDDPIVRDGGGLDQGAEPAIEVIAPRDRASLSPDSLAFAWRPVAEEAFYTFTLTNAVGDVVWEGSTSDTVLTLTGKVMLEPEGRYFWYVDALYDGGASSSTGVRELTATR